MRTLRVRGTLSNERGAALFAAVLGLLVLSITLAGFMMLGRDEVLMASNDVQQVQATYAAEAGANHGRWMLAQRIRVDLPTQVSTTPRPAMATSLNTTYNSPAGAAQFIVDQAQGAGGPNFVLCTGVAGGCPEPSYTAEIPDSQQAVLTLTSTTPAYTGRLIVSVPPATPPVVTNGGSSALLTYQWRVESIGTSGRANIQVIADSASAGNPSGQFIIALQAGFVQYAHFIDQMDSSSPWVSFRHVYTGPVHTNQRYNILGQAPTTPVGPTFRSEATQTFTDTRFNNGGSVVIQARDSTAVDEPILGVAPGAPCTAVDCTGFTRGYDYDPTTAAIDPIPVPSGGSNTDRINQINSALGNMAAPGCVGGGGCPVPVIVTNEIGAAGSNNPGYWTDGGGAPLFFKGGIFVQGTVLDLQLAAQPGAPNGQQIEIYTPPVGGAEQRTLIVENQVTNTITVTRQCRNGAGKCSGGGWSTNALTTAAPAGTLPAGVAAVQTMTGRFSPSASTDNGVIFVTGDIGSNSDQGLRRDISGGFSAAIDQNTRLTIGAGALGITGIAIDQPSATRGDIFITGEVNYQVDPRGGDGVFSTPIPGSGDDNLTPQNVLGVVSWDGGIRLSSALNGDLRLHGEYMAPNLTGGGSPEGQIRFEDCGGSYRGIVNLLGGVVQQTMGCFGSPGSPGLGYARNWVYDERFRYRALSPPSFPGFPRFTVTTGVGIDSYGWRAGRY